MDDSFFIGFVLGHGLGRAEARAQCAEILAKNERAMTALIERHSAIVDASFERLKAITDTAFAQMANLIEADAFAKPGPPPRRLIQ